MQPEHLFADLFYGYPTCTVGYEDHLPSLAVLPRRGKEVINIIKEFPPSVEDIKLSRDEVPVRDARPEAPSEYPGVATQIWEEVSRPKSPQVDGFISLPVIARPSVNRGLRFLQWALSRCWRATMAAGASSRDPAGPGDCEIVG